MFVSAVAVFVNLVKGVDVDVLQHPWGKSIQTPKCVLPCIFVLDYGGHLNIKFTDKTRVLHVAEIMSFVSCSSWTGHFWCEPRG